MIAKEKAKLVLETQTEDVSDSPLTGEVWPPVRQKTHSSVPPSERQKFVAFEIDSPTMVSPPIIKPDPDLGSQQEDTPPADFPAPKNELADAVVEITPVDIKKERLIMFFVYFVYFLSFFHNPVLYLIVKLLSNIIEHFYTN